MKTLIELQHLVDTHDCPFAVINARFSILSVNAAFVEEFQIEHKDIIGKKFLGVIAGVDKDFPQKQFHQPIKIGLCGHTCSNGNGSKRYIIKSSPIRGMRGTNYIGLSFKSFASIYQK